MSNDPKNNKATGATQPVNQPNEVDQAIADYNMHGLTIQADLEKRKEEAEAAKAFREEQYKAAEEARKKGHSLVGAYIEKRKPKYDVDKEKRMRNAAIIRSLGDALAAATQGFHAYGKKGAGVVLTPPPSNAMEGVNKINEMQQKYLQEHKAWEDLNLNWQQQKAQSDIEAANALALRAENDYKMSLGDVKETEALLRANADTIRTLRTNAMLGEKERKDNIADYETKAKIDRKYAVGRGGGRSGGGGTSSSEEKSLGQYYYNRNPRLDAEDKAIAWSSLSPAEKESYNRRASNDPRTVIAMGLMAAGYDGAQTDNILDAFEKTSRDNDKNALDMYMDVISTFQKGENSLMDIINAQIDTMRGFL